MDMKKMAENIYRQEITHAEKIKLLNQLIFDCNEELEAQNENMQPQVKHNLAEGLRVATDYIRRLTNNV